MTKRFTGLGVALITPFTEQGSIDFPALERMVHHLCGSKAHFLVVLGSTGEAQ
ncbi:MAG: dihydrodipicolinate synthase family protein, partial [Bacteroidota bacterium]|nr:dihydrodipicolinate synthase family protein [Bacteroidota bacterium]